jgi:hypothetical protein
MATKLISRRDILAFWGVVGAVGLFPTVGKSAWYQQAPRTTNPTSLESHPASSEEALQRLEGGNTRFAKGQPKHSQESLGIRKQLTSEQHPSPPFLDAVTPVYE